MDYSRPVPIPHQMVGCCRGRSSQQHCMCCVYFTGHIEPSPTSASESSNAAYCSAQQGAAAGYFHAAWHGMSCSTQCTPHRQHKHPIATFQEPANHATHTSSLNEQISAPSSSAFKRICLSNLGRRVCKCLLPPKPSHVGFTTSQAGEPDPRPCRRG
jgi:hypothetical protein